MNFIVSSLCFIIITCLQVNDSLACASKDLKTVNYGCQLRCSSVSGDYKLEDLSEGKQCPTWFGNSIRICLKGECVMETSPDPTPEERPEETEAKKACYVIYKQEAQQAKYLNYDCKLRCDLNGNTYFHNLYEDSPCPKWFGGSYRVCKRGECLIQ